MGGGEPIPPGATSSRGGAKKALLIGGGALGAGAVGVAAWAAIGFFSTGAQPAEALPANTLVYVSVDLDPAGGQKIEALQTLNKFPAFKDQLKMDTDDNVVQKLIDRILEEAPCDDLDFAADFEPWIGSRAAVAGIPGGEDGAFPAFVLQASDAAAAEAALTKVAECGAESGEAEDLAFEASGEWVVFAETAEQVSQVVDGAAQGSLADDADYLRWTDEAGDAGFVAMYAAPAIGPFLADNPGFLSGEAFVGEDLGELPSDPVSEAMAEDFREFGGAAAVIRFADGGLEFETATANSIDLFDIYTAGSTEEVMGSLPAETALAFGVGFAPGWVDSFLDLMAPALEEEDLTVDELLEEAEVQTGLELPEDIETLFGSAAVVSMSADFDVEAFQDNPDPSDLPLAIKVQGSPDDIEAVLDKIRPQVPGEVAEVLDTDIEDDRIVIGPNADYRALVVEEGSLGQDPVFQDVIRFTESGYVLFVNMNRFDDVVELLAGDDEDASEVIENLEPIAGFGSSTTAEGDVLRSVVRITTD